MHCVALQRCVSLQACACPCLGDGQHVAAPQGCLSKCSHLRRSLVQVKACAHLEFALCARHVCTCVENVRLERENELYALRHDPGLVHVPAGLAQAAHPLFLPNQEHQCLRTPCSTFLRSRLLCSRMQCLFLQTWDKSPKAATAHQSRASWHTEPVRARQSWQSWRAGCPGAAVQDSLLHLSCSKNGTEGCSSRTVQRFAG